MTRAELFGAFRAEYRRRRFVAGLLLAFVGFLRRLDALGGRYSSLEAFLKAHARQETVRGGKRANTLVVDDGAGHTLSLRPFYNDAERFFRSEHKRFDYPNCAPHATQAWADYPAWLEALLALSAEEIATLEADVVAFVLGDLPSHEVDGNTLAPFSRPFTALLDTFPLAAQAGEPHGSTFQGIVYAFMRADAPHLHLEVSKVGAGGKRLQRIGDVDGWEGARLIVSAEVKHFTVGDGEVNGFVPFAGEIGKRKAMGIVVAEGFSGEAATRLETLGLRAVSLQDLRRISDLWDPLKQRAAGLSFAYYVHHVEKNAALMRRLNEWEADQA